MKVKRILFYRNPKLVKGCWTRRIGISMSYMPNSGISRFSLFVYLYWVTLLIRAGITNKEVYQMHFQWLDGRRTELVEQTSIGSKAEMQAWIKRVQNEHALPENARWMMCMEDSEDFVMCADEAKC